MNPLRVAPVLSIACLSLLHAASSAAATLFLKGGSLYGPGNKGVHAAQNGEVRNMIFTAPFAGIIPFFNNGAAAPNIVGEALQGGPVDGMISDGRLINENVDVGLHFVLHDPDTGETARIIVAAVGAEDFGPDPDGNLAFDTDVVADPGQGHLIRPLNVTFTSGVARIPLSLRTQLGLSGGHDVAGPFNAGHALIGRIGDFDNDGLLDGELVLAGNTTLDMVIAHGDPIAQRRPFVSDIPLTPDLSALLIVNGIVRNFPQPLSEVLQRGDVLQAVNYGFDITDRLNAVLHNFNSILAVQTASAEQLRRVRKMRSLIRKARSHIEQALDTLANPEIDASGVASGAEELREGLTGLGLVLGQLAEQSPQAAARSTS
jgi:hypothetical protein